MSGNIQGHPDEIKFLTLSGSTVNIKVAEIEKLSSSMRGKIHLPGSRKYEALRKIWNGRFQRYPAAIAECRETADVSKVVRFARSYNIFVTIRSGGHHISGIALHDGALTIDLSYMNKVVVDPKGMRVVAQAGCTLGDVDRATQLYGLATPFGVVSKTGIAGLTLGGGIGHLRRKYGLTIDNLLSVEIVMADGSVITASTTQNQDLFWALRGAGMGNFGVVTKFEYKLHRVGPMLYQVYTAYPLEEGVEVMKNGKQFFTEDLDYNISAEFLLQKVPDSRLYPMEIRGRRVVVMRGVYAGDVEEGRRKMEPLRHLGTPIYDSSGPRSYIDIQTYKDETTPDGLRYYSTGLMLPELKDEFIELMVEEYSTVSFEDVGVTGIWHTGGAIKRVGIDETAYSARDNEFMVVIDLAWSDPKEDKAQIRWAKTLKKKIKQLYPTIEEKAYINFTPGDNEKFEALTAYSKNLKKLLEIKKNYDPDNFFCCGTLRSYFSKATRVKQ